jgi:hypothetical protein
VGELPFVTPRIGGGHGDLDAPDADGDARTDLEQLESDGAATGVGELSEAQTNAAYLT